MTPSERRPPRSLLINYRGLLGAGAAAALLLAGPSLAHAQQLVVDAANGNSPYTFSASATYIYVAVGNTSTGVLNHSTGTLTGNGAFDVGGGSGSQGTYNLSGTGAVVLSGTPLQIGSNGTGTFNQSGGSNSGSELYVGKSGNGTYSLSGGVLSAGPSYIAWNRGSTGTFTQSGGTHNLGGFFEIGYFGTASYTLSGTGVLNAGNEDLGYGDSSIGTFTQNGGTHTVSGSRLLVGIQAGSSGTYKLNAGTLITRRVIGGSGTSVFNFNGGTLKAYAGDNPSASNIFVSGLGTANVQAGGAKIDTNGFTVTAAQNFVHDTTAGAPATDGGLIKSGAGTLTLTGANTYTGGTTFEAGIVNVGSAGALGTSGTLLFTGGSLQYSAANTTDYSGRFGPAANQPYYSIDTNGQNVTFGNALGSTNTGGLTKLGSGTLTLAATSSYPATTTVSGGTLLISGRLANTNGIVLNNGGTLRLSGSNSVTDRLIDAAPVTINGGATLATGGLKEGTAPTAAGGVGGTAGLGALNLSATTSSARVIFDFANTATGSTLVFSSRTAGSSGAFVSVLNWTGTPGSDGGSSTNDRLLFQTNPGFTAADLANFQFSNDSGVNYVSGAVLINYNGYYELVPTPNTAPTASASPNPVTTNQDTAVTFNLTGTDPNDHSLTFPITAQPTHGTLSAVSASNCSAVNTCTATVTYTPTPNYGGSDSFKFKANDGTDDSAEVTVSITVTPNQAPAITSANATTFSVGSAGTFTVTTTGAPAPTVTQTGALPNGVTFNSATAKLSGTPAAGTGGTYPITFTASNGVAPNATQSFTLTVNQPPAITSANATTFVVGSAGSFTVTTTGFPNPTVSQTGSLPSGVTFDAATKTLSGTPGAGTGGTYTISFTAANGVGSNAVQSFTLTVNQAPAITSANSATFTVGTAGTFTVTATGFPSPTFSVTGALPAGVSLAANTGVLSGTPGPDTQGAYNLTMMASNGVGSAASQPFTLTVNAIPCFAAPSGMISWLAGNGNANDLVGGNNAVLQSGASFGSGKVGQAFDLGNAPNATSGQSVNVATPVGLPVGNAARTVEMWFNTGTPLTTSPNAALFQYGTATIEKSFGLVFTAANPGKLMFNGSGDDGVGTTTVTSGVWHHVAVTYDGASVKLYLDGQLDGSKATALLDTVLDANGLTIGLRPGVSVFNGKIDEVQIFDRALTQAEIQATYYAGARGTCAPPLALSSAVSRKTHTGVGARDVPMPLSGNAGVEPRNGTPAGAHTIVFTFTNSITSGSASVTSGTGTASAPAFSGNTMTVNLTGVTNAQQITVTLTGVTDALGQAVPTTGVNMKFLSGDVNGDGFVNSGDALVTRNRSGQATDNTNFRSDINKDGAVNGGDATLVKSAAGTSVTAAAEAGTSAAGNEASASAEDATSPAGGDIVIPVPSDEQ